MSFLKYPLYCLTLLGLCSCVSTKDYTLEPIKIVLIGDSTMATKKESARPETGWGEALEAFFDGSVQVSNHALNGRSSKSFIDEGRWDAALEELSTGDTLVIQFGHNDEKYKDPSRYTIPWESYSENLRRFTREALSKEANVIIASSICRRKFGEDGSPQDTHGDYPAAAKSVAKELGVAFVDMEVLTRAMLVELGPDASVKLFLHLQPGESVNYPDGKNDDTHLNETGAAAHAKLFVGSIIDQKLPLAKRLKQYVF